MEIKTTNICEEKDKAHENEYVAEIHVINHGETNIYSKYFYTSKNNFDIKDLKELPDNVFMIEIFKKKRKMFGMSDKVEKQDMKRYLFGRFFPLEEYVELTKSNPSNGNKDILGYLVATDGNTIVNIDDDLYRNCSIIDNRKVVGGIYQQDKILDKKPYPKVIINAMVHNDMKENPSSEYRKVRFKDKNYQLYILKKEGENSHYKYLFELQSWSNDMIGEAEISINLGDLHDYADYSMKKRPQIYFELDNIIIDPAYREQKLDALLMNEVLSYIKKFNNSYALNAPLSIRCENDEEKLSLYKEMGAVDNNMSKNPHANDTNLIIEDVSANKEKYPFHALDKHYMVGENTKFYDFEAEDTI